MHKITDMEPENKPLTILDLKKVTWIAAALVALATFIVYLSALQNGFVNWDDDILVYENPYVRSIDFRLLGWDITTITEIWTPLIVLSFAFDYAVWNLDPMGYHLTNIIFHTLNTLLVFILVVRLIRSKHGTHPHPSCFIAASVTALLFAIHPLRVESVVWIAERKDVLYSFFFLLSILAYIRYASTDDSKRFNYYSVALLFFIFSLMSKPMAVSLPLVLLILDFYPLGRLTVRGVPRNVKWIFIEKLPFFLLTILLSLMTLSAISSRVNPLEKIISAPGLFKEQVFIITHSFMFYLGKMLLPFNLAPLYPSLTNTNYFTLEYMGSLLLFIAITFFSIKSVKRNKMFAVVWFYYIATLMPVIWIGKLNSFATADRYTYLPSLGPFLLMGLGIAALIVKYTAGRNHIAIIAILLLISSILGIKTVRQVSIWKDSITLWSHEIILFPNLHVAYNNRGRAYGDLGNYQQALKDLGKAIEFDLLHADAHAYCNRGIIYYRLGEYQQAITDLNRAIELKPGSVAAYYNRGLVYSEIGNYVLAVKDYSAASQLDPGYAKAYNNRGNTYFKMGNYALAVKDLSKAIELNPEYQKAYNNRGITYMTLSEYQEAIKDLSMVIKLNPGDAKAYSLRGAAYVNASNYRQAIEDLDMAVKFNPQDEIAYRNRGIAYRSLGNNGQALKDFKKAEEIKHR